jgi:glycosyltransferase A (GT-A) superfamily protein (DUF2064 family)
VSVLPVTMLVMAKAPVPGQAKTRLAAAVGDRVAAEIAAAALLDTLDAVLATPAAERVVAMTGELDAAAESHDIAGRLDSFTVIAQRGDGFADRLANAHLDAGGRYPVFQIGMDTPQVSAELLTACGRRLNGAPAVLGFAPDGGWWALGLRTPAAAECLRGVAMSRPDTGDLTLDALSRSGLEVTVIDELADVDVVEDIDVVRRACRPTSRFARRTRAAGL